MTRIAEVILGREHPKRISLFHRCTQTSHSLRLRKLDVLIHQWHIRIVQVSHFGACANHLFSLTGQLSVEGTFPQRSDDKKDFLHYTNI